MKIDLSDVDLDILRAALGFMSIKHESSYVADAAEDLWQRMAKQAGPDLHAKLRQIRTPTVAVVVQRKKAAAACRYHQKYGRRYGLGDTELCLECT